MTTETIHTLGGLKSILKTVKRVCVWVAWEPDGDGSYIPLSKAAFLRGIGADVPHTGADGGPADWTAVVAHVEGDTLYVGG